MSVYCLHVILIFLQATLEQRVAIRFLNVISHFCQNNNTMQNWTNRMVATHVGLGTAWAIHSSVWSELKSTYLIWGRTKSTSTTGEMFFARNFLQNPTSRHLKCCFKVRNLPLSLRSLGLPDLSGVLYAGTLFSVQIASYIAVCLLPLCC